MKLYQALIFLAVLLDFFLGAYILFLDRTARMNRLYSLVLLCLVTWGTGEVLRNLSPDIATATRWNHLVVLAFTLIPSLYLHFTLEFTHHRLPVATAWLYLPSPVFLLLFWFTSWTFGELTRMPWGYAIQFGPAYPLFLLYLQGFFLYALWRCFRWWGRAPTRREQTQAGFVLVGTAIPFVGGSLTNAFLPLLGIQVPRLAVLLTTLNALLVGFAIVRFRLMAVTPTLAAESLIRTMGEGMLVISPEGRVVLVNPALSSFLGRAAGELIGTDMSELVAQDDRPMFLDAQRDCLAGKFSVKHLDLHLLSRDGDAIPVSMVSTPIRDAGGDIVGMLGVVRDMRQINKLIRDSLDAEAESRRRAQELETLSAVGRLIGTSLDPAEVASLVAQSAFRLLPGTTAWVLRLDPAKNLLVVMAAADTNGPLHPSPFRIPRSEGVTGLAVESGHPVWSRDILSDPRLTLSEPFREFVRLFGWRSVLGVPLIRRGEVVGVLSLTRNEPGEFSDEEIRLLQTFADQAAIALENAGLHETTEARLRETETLLSVSQSVNSTLDLTEALRRVARETARALGADMVGAYLATPDRTALYPIAGYHVPKEKLREFLEVPIPIPGHRGAEEAFTLRAPAFTSNASEDLRVDREMLRRFPHRSTFFCPIVVKEEPIGALIAIWWTAERHFTENELRLVEGISRQAALAVENTRLHQDLRDKMEELQRTQSQLIQSAKLAALGELVANIAHEINNPLTSILGYAAFLRQRELPGSVATDLAIIEKEGLRARKIVRDLLDFARQREPKLEELDLKGIVQEMVGLLRRQAEVADVRIIERYSEPAAVVLADSGQLKQVFMNLLANGLDAMPRGGTLTVAVAEAHDGWVEATVSDTGVGIAPEHAPRIFEPFFTTKPEVKGTGLGLSVSLGIIQNHGGNLTVASEPGRGATFTVRLPRAHAPTRRR